MATIHVNVPTAVPIFDYGLGLIGAAIGRYATVRLEVTGNGVEGSADVLKGARAVFSAAQTAPAGLWIDVEYTPLPRFADTTLPLIVAGAAAANTLLGTPFTRQQVHHALIQAGFSAALTAAALFGGVQMAAQVQGVTLQTEITTHIREIGLLRPADAAPIPPPTTEDAAAAVLATALHLSKGTLINPLPFEGPEWYATLTKIANTHDLYHLSPAGTSALAVDDHHFPAKLTLIAESFEERIGQTLEVAILPINRQGVSISEYGTVTPNTPTPYHE